MSRESTTAQDLGARLRLRREAMKLSQSEVAARAGVARQLVSRIEHGHPRAELGGVMAIVRALGAEVRLDDAAPSQPADLDPFFQG